MILPRYRIRIAGAPQFMRRKNKNGDTACPMRLKSLIADMKRRIGTLK